ncbi:MAG: hypothetical protein ACON4F_06900 [Candidatus Puniceispirillaceae bacterium]
MKNSQKWLIGGGLILTGTLVAGLAVAKIGHHHSYHHDGYGGYHYDDDEDGRFGKHGHKMKGDRGGKIMSNRADLLENLDMRFKALDADGNGQVTAEEFNNPILSRFDSMDADGNGIISREERRAYKKDMRKKFKEMMDKQGQTDTPAAS